MALDSGLTVLVCSIFFVFLSLLRQNVLIFVSHNLDHRPLITPSQKQLFRSFDVDSNGIIDQDEFFFIAKIFHVDDESEVPEAKLDEIFINIRLNYAGSSVFPAAEKEAAFKTRTFSMFHPRLLSLGHSWSVYKGVKSSPHQHYSSPIRPNYSHYPLYQILAMLHWNVIFNTPSQTAITAAIVTGISDTHVRIGFMISAEYQVSTPPNPPVWFTPCHVNPSESGDCHLVGQAVFNLSDMVLEYFELSCREECAGDVLQIRSVGGPYEYKIQQNKLAAVPLTHENVDGGVSYAWHEELPGWTDILYKTEF